MATRTLVLCKRAFIGDQTSGCWLVNASLTRNIRELLSSIFLSFWIILPMWSKESNTYSWSEILRLHRLLTIFVRYHTFDRYKLHIILRPFNLKAWQNVLCSPYTVINDNDIINILKVTQFIIQYQDLRAQSWWNSKCHPWRNWIRLMKSDIMGLCERGW